MNSLELEKEIAMNAKEARGIVDLWNNETPMKRMLVMDQVVFSKGYLSCLEGPEVKALVKALEKSLDCNGHTFYFCGCESSLTESLSIFRESVKKLEKDKED
jgi:hypothetical protein